MFKHSTCLAIAMLSTTYLSAIQVENQAPYSCALWKFSYIIGQEVYIKKIILKTNETFIDSDVKGVTIYSNHQHTLHIQDLTNNEHVILYDVDGKLNLKFA
jgi:hypothetical protein